MIRKVEQYKNYNGCWGYHHVKKREEGENHLCTFGKCV